MLIRRICAISPPSPTGTGSEFRRRCNRCKGWVIPGRESSTRTLSAPQDEVFEIVTDPSRLPSWNDGIAQVIDAPNHLEPGSEWRVRLQVLGRAWVSRSTVSRIDPAKGYFSYRSHTDDGNPSFADWVWNIAPDPEGCRVDVSVSLHPLTFWRKHVLVRVRQPLLRREMERSLAALDEFTCGCLAPLSSGPALSAAAADKESSNA
jgi:uncharacterized protein YndB with AHSA1/START domain